VIARGVVYLIDDDEALLHSIGMLLGTEGYRVRPFGSAEEFLGAVDPENSGVVVTDVNMSGMSGVQLLAKMKELCLSMPVIVITGYANVALAVQAMKNGARDLLEKPVSAEDLTAAVEQAFAEEVGIGAEGSASQELAGRFANLSRREKEVLDGVLRGQVNKVIAHELGISRRTVEIHRANLMKKTGAGSLAELVRLTLAVDRA